MNREKTLYVSDLDGTLLRGDQTLSDFTVETINALTEQGMLFSYATARSYVTAKPVTEGLTAGLPVIVYNGSFIVESGTEKRLMVNAFAAKDSCRILDALLIHELYPIVYAFVEGVEKFSYCPQRETRGMKLFQDTRRGDVRDNPVSDEAELYRGDIFHFTCIDEEEKLLPLYERFRGEFACIFHRDIYSGEPWLEIQPVGATKARAVLSLKERMGCERVVCFGDGKNDISMFRVADECYAVENAHEDLKRIATGVIESNENDGVAKWLLRRTGRGG